MAEPVDVLREFFARRRKVHLVMPDGWVGRPYDNWYGLASASVDGDRLTIGLDTEESIVVPLDAVLEDVGGSLLISGFDPATFHPYGADARTYREGLIELVGVGAQQVGTTTDDEG